MKLPVPLLPLLGQGEFHVISANQVFKGPGLHLRDEGGECFRERIQVRLFPSFGFFDVFGLAGLCGKRTGRKACEGSWANLVPLKPLFSNSSSKISRRAADVLIRPRTSVLITPSTA